MTQAFRPSSLAEALRLLSDPIVAPVPVAGCTDVMVLDHAARREHKAVLDLSALAELKGIGWTEAGLELGALTTFTALRQDAECRRRLPVLGEMAGMIGAWQIQNRATIGGNIANASPAGDSLPVWLALDAELVLQSVAGRRILPYRQFNLGYRKTALRPGELIVQVRVPKPVLAWRHAFFKVGTRAAQAISKAVLACSVQLSPSGDIEQVRIGAGSVAPTPVRLEQCERALTGQRITPELAERAGAIAAHEVQPIDDLRSTAAYRRFVVGRLVRRWLLEQRV